MPGKILDFRDRRGVLRPAQRGLAIALLLIYATTAIGVPLPQVGDRAVAGAAYPCAGSSCGCASAERCWQSCCCHTLAQRLQWARTRGVQPPAFALEAARKAGLLDDATSICAEIDAKKDCCSKQTQTGHASPWMTKLAALTEGATTETTSDRDAQVSPSAVGEKDSHFVVAWRALGCNGQSMNWLAAVPAVVLPVSDFVTFPSFADWLGPLASETATGNSLDLVTPPPELS
jgi:hypothetical protein